MAKMLMKKDVAIQCDEFDLESIPIIVLEVSNTFFLCSFSELVNLIIDRKLVKISDNLILSLY